MKERLQTTGKLDNGFSGLKSKCFFVPDFVAKKFLKFNAFDKLGRESPLYGY
jgi:hypothetical protein